MWEDKINNQDQNNITNDHKKSPNKTSTKKFTRELNKRDAHS